MDEYKTYLASDTFNLFMDQTLREFACDTVEKLCCHYSPKHYLVSTQLQSISAVITAGGMDELTKLSSKQAEKENKKNQLFWSFVSSHIMLGSQDDTSFSMAIRQRIVPFLKDESAAEDKVNRNRIKKQNKEKLKLAVEQALPIYFEHFICHYAYCAARQ